MWLCSSLSGGSLAYSRREARGAVGGLCGVLRLGQASWVLRCLAPALCQSLTASASCFSGPVFPNPTLYSLQSLSLPCAQGPCRMAEPFSHIVLGACISDMQLSLVFVSQLLTSCGVWACCACGHPELGAACSPTAPDSHRHSESGERKGSRRVLFSPLARTVPSRKKPHGFCEQGLSLTVHHSAVMVHPTAAPRMVSGAEGEPGLALPGPGRWTWRIPCR